MIANLKKANSQKIAREYTKVTGRQVADPSADRQLMIAVLEGRRSESNLAGATTINPYRIGEVIAQRQLIEGMRKLNDSQIRSMRFGHSVGVSYAELGRAFNTSAKRVAAICKFEAYKDVR